VGRNDPLMRVGGIATLAMSLRRMGDEELSKEMRTVSKAAAEKIVPFAKKRVPVRTGALQGSITASSTRRAGLILAGTGVKTKPYAYKIHAGFNRGGRQGRYVGKKYISKAVPEAWPQIIDEYVRGMNRIAKRFEKKHGVSRVYGGFKK
jgi:hypothetical protein